MNTATRNCLVKELTDGGAAMIVWALVSAIGPGNVTYTKDGKEESAEAEAVVLAIGVKPVDGLYASLRGLVDNLHVIGDARAPRDIMHAVRERLRDPWDFPYFYCRAFRTCRRPYSGAPPCPPVVLARRFQASPNYYRVAIHHPRLYQQLPTG